MSDRAADYFADQDRRDKEVRLASVARQIRNDMHLKTVLLDIDVKERRKCYEALKPNLLFAPLPYKRLMRLAPAYSGRVN